MHISRFGNSLLSQWCVSVSRLSNSIWSVVIEEKRLWLVFQFSSFWYGKGRIPPPTHTPVDVVQIVLHCSQYLILLVELSFPPNFLTDTDQDHVWKFSDVQFCPNWIETRNVQNLTNFQNLIFVGISCSFEVKTWFLSLQWLYSRQKAYKWYRWRWYAWKTTYLWEGRVPKKCWVAYQWVSKNLKADRPISKSVIIYFYSKKIWDPFDITA